MPELFLASLVNADTQFLFFSSCYFISWELSLQNLSPAAGALQKGRSTKRKSGKSLYISPNPLGLSHSLFVLL